MIASIVYYHIYFQAIKKGAVKQKTDETSDNDCLCPLNNWEWSSNLRHFSGMNKQFGGVNYELCPL